jgi:hypothetical protein
MKIESSNEIISQLLECGLITYDEEEIEEIDEDDLFGEIKSLSDGLSNFSLGGYEVYQFDGSSVSSPFSWEGDQDIIIIWEKYDELEDFVKQEVVVYLSEQSSDYFDYEFIVYNGYTVDSESEVLSYFADQERDWVFDREMDELINTYDEFADMETELEDNVSNLEDRLEVEEATKEAIDKAMESGDPEPLQDWYTSTFKVSNIPEGDVSYAQDKSKKILDFLQSFDETDADYNQGISFLEALADDDVEVEDKDKVETYISLLVIVYEDLEVDFDEIKDKVLESESLIETEQGYVETYQESGTLPDGTDYKYQVIYEDLYDSEFLRGYDTVFEFMVNERGMGEYNVIEDIYGGINYEAYADYIVNAYGVDAYLPNEDKYVHECEELFYYYE